MRLTLAAALALVALVAAAPAASAAPALTRCPGQDAFGCGVLDVPLDRTGTVPGEIPIHYAIQRRGPQPVLIALSGGPGQSSVGSASSFALSLQPALRRYRLAVLDQRGTGESGLIDCPSVQGLRSLDAFLPSALAACADRIGSARAFYSTADTVLDVDALRQALGVERIALMGISYGTNVALQYARAFPEHVDRLILDSIVGPDGPDAFLLDTYRNFPRVLREQCADSACRGITRDPVADVGALVARLNRGPLLGSFFDAAGARRQTLYHNPDELSFLLTAGDLNPFLQAELPAAISAARLGDTALLMRLRRVAQGGPTRASELSFGLNVTTGCEDAPLPYPLATTPIPDRAAIAQGALAAIPPTEYQPFDAQTVLRTSYVDDCLDWPMDSFRPPFTGPLPDVPALLLGGRLDTRTPVENAFATARELPHASVVALRGSGHDVLDSDVTGCSTRALTRFIAGTPVGAPCAGKDNGVSPIPLPPRSLEDFRRAPGVAGERGRALFGVLDTAIDARLSALQALFAGVTVRGGGLRGGSYSGAAALEGNVRLRRYAYVPGLRVSGTLRTSTGRITGTVRVEGKGVDGRLTLDRRGGARGVLGGRAVRYEPKGGAAAASASLRAGGARTPLRLDARLRLPRP